MGGLPVFERIDVGGVPVVWTTGAPEPFVVGIIFRVGRADETMVRGGLTHLVEHLALPAGLTTGIDFNASVEMVTTQFWAIGDRDVALAHLTGLTERLSQLPRERIGRERDILRAEAGTRSSNDWTLGLALRYGPIAHGQTGYYELGLEGASDDEIVDWARTRFTSGNAAVYMTAPPPADLRLGLPAGPRTPCPSERPIPYVRYPSAYTVGHEGGIALTMLFDRSYATGTGIQIAIERMRGHLREQAGTTYGVDWRYEALDSKRAHVLIWADCLPAELTATRNRMLAVLDDLARFGPTEAELEAERSSYQRIVSDPNAYSSYLHFLAHDLVLDRPMESLDERLERQWEVTAAQVATAIAEAVETMLLLLPEGGGMPGGRFSEYPLEPPQAPQGRTHWATAAKPWRRRRALSERLVVGDEGVSYGTEHWRRAVMFDRCVAVLRWQDGVRGLWSDDGFYVQVDPAEWRGGAQAVQLIDERTTSDLWVEIGAEAASGLAAEIAAAVEGEAWEEQIATLRAALERDAGNAHAWGYLANAYENLERWTQALDAAERASELDPGDPWAFGCKARALRRLDRRDDAIRAVEEAVRLDPSGAATLSDSAWLLAELAERERAAHYAARAVELHPEFVPSWLARASVLQEAGDLVEAERALRHALELDPDNARANNNLGWLLISAKRYREALLPLRRALELDPSDATATWNLAVAEALTGNRQLARKLRVARSEEQLARTTTELAESPGHPALHRRLAQTLGALGRHTEALAEARAAVAAAPADPWAIEQAAWSAINAHEELEAQEHLRRLSALPDREHSSYASEAELAALLADAGTAAQAAAEAERLSPHEGERRLAQGCAAAAAGDWPSARDSFRLALRADPHDCCAQTWRGLAAAAGADLEGAVRAFERAEALEMCDCASRQRLRAASES